MPHTVSIIVPTFNRAHYLAECLDSLLAQTTPAYEILVVDDGSEDATAEVVAKYGQKVRYLYKENGGKPTAVNLALTYCTGTLIWLFDDDDVALPNAIEDRIAALDATPTAGFVYSPHFVGTDGADGRIVRGQLNQPNQYSTDEFFLEIMRGCFYHLATTLVRRELYLALDGLDPALIRGQDYDFQIRLARIAKPVYCATPAFIFRQHTGVRGTKSMRHTETQRGSVFRNFSLAVGRKIHASVMLGEYLTPPSFETLSKSENKQALLNRVHVMANHGCITEILEDLATFLRVDSGNCPISKLEVHAISKAICTGWAYEAIAQDWMQFIEKARGLKEYPGGNTILRAIALGMFKLAQSYPGTPSARAIKLLKASQLAFESFKR